MKIFGAAVALSMMFAAVPAKAADFITYQGFSTGTAQFFDNLSPAPPITKATGYMFTFIVSLDPAQDPKAEIQGSNLFLTTYALFEEFQATACLAQPTNGVFPASDPALIAGCGSTIHIVGKNSGYRFFGNLYDLKAEASFGTPARTGLVGSEFFDLPTSAVPEPSTWLMMIIGFGMVGSAMRRRAGWKRAIA